MLSGCWCLCVVGIYAWLGFLRGWDFCVAKKVDLRKLNLTGVALFVHFWLSMAKRVDLRKLNLTGVALFVHCMNQG